MVVEVTALGIHSVWEVRGREWVARPAEARRVVAGMRQPKAPTDENPECVREERDCPWLAWLYGLYYGGVDTVDMDADLTRFDHKSSVPERCRSYHRIWWRARKHVCAA